MATILDDAESMLDEAFFEASSTRASDDSAGDGSTTGTNVDYHARQYPAYQPPHLRGHNTQQDDFVNFKAMKNGADNPDKKEGVDNDKYQRLKLPVPFALSRNKLQALKMQFPGVYFHCKDNGNHDHEFSHIVTMIGTRMMQRAYPMGSRILDMYGNPNACDTYNKNQLRRAPDNARTMKAAVHKFGPADFIREVNKWGPKMDAEENERYYTSSLRQMIDSGELDKFDIMQFTHTLYYVDFRELVEALHQGKKRTAYALIHRHQNSKGTINDGEQEYEKKTVNMFGKEVTLLRQINVSTRAAYVHPDLTPLIFKEGEKQWYPEDSLDTRSSEGKVSNMGLSWDFKMVNEETWIIQLCPITRSEPEPGEVNYAEIFMNGGTSESDAIREEVFADDPFNMDLPSTPPSSSSGSCVSVFDHTVTVPGERGEFVKIELTNMQLFEKLRANVAGKKRDPTVFNEIIRLAKHLNDPSTITGDKIGMAVEASKIIDHVVAAFVVDIESESQVLGVTRTLQPILHAHASKFGFKADPKHMTFGSLLGTIRVLLGVGVELNQVYKSKDKIGRVLEAGIQRIDDYC